MEVAAEDLKIDFNEDRAMMLETAEAFCRDKSPIAQVRNRLGPDTHFAEDLWQEITELGWLGLIVPEKYGGIGLGFAEAVTVMEPMGRTLMGLPFMNATLVAAALLNAGTDRQKQELLPTIAAGNVATLALSEPHGDWALENITCIGTRSGDEITLSGTKTFVLDADRAEIFLISFLLDGAPALAILDDHSNLRLQREVVMDETRRSFRLTLDGVTLQSEQLLQTEQVATALHQLEQAACLLLSAEICGGLASVIDVTVDYLNSRRQFDRFIGSYQGLKHPMADILTQYDGARSLLYHAASIFDDPGNPEEREIAVRMAKAYGTDAFAYAGDRAIQFHGAFGFTYDCDAQLFLRRALWCQTQFGDAPYHRTKLQDLLL